MPKIASISSTWSGAALLCLLPLIAIGDAVTDWSARGAEVLVPFKQNLMGALKDGLAQGPVEAIQACRLEAPQIATQSGGGDYRVGRTSHKLRNPANVPRDWMQPLLDHYLAHPDDHAPRVVALDNGGKGYVEPIQVNPMCLTCHGAAIDETVRARLKELYPDDQATGFNDGDFRGLFWVEFRNQM
jgi:hypothetical protein